MADLAGLPRDQLAGMAEAGAEIAECYRLLEKGGGNVVGDLLRGHGEFFEWDHYPPGDVYDPETHCQYYYHAHPVALRGGEHGHFHTFLRPKGMPEGIAPAPVADYAPPDGDNDALSHLIAISMDKYGKPIRLFTTNRWVTGEIWYTADDVIGMLDRFHMDLAYPSLAVNIWVTAMLRLFRPEIESLVRARDVRVADWQAKKTNENVFEDRELEITSTLDIDVTRQVRRVEAALQGA